MNRRKFLESVSLASVGGFFLSSFTPTFASALGGASNDRALVIIQLVGGNDGLNTVIPISSYSQLSQLRSNIIIPQSSVLSLSGLSGTGLHPSMTGMRDLWNEGKLSIIQGVGYPNPNFSHFRASDIYETGSNADQILNSGWVGRYLNYEYPNYPVGYPNTEVPHPLAIRVDGSVGIGLQNMGISMGISINNTQDPLNLTGNIYNDVPTSDCKGDKLRLVRTVQKQTDLYGNVVQSAASTNCQHSNLYPTYGVGARLAAALKIVAKMICGGLTTKIYWVSMGGFDTHSQQVDQSNHVNGTHANLLGALSNCIKAFQDDMENMGASDRVIGMAFSEFGRRITSNGSFGTDHGSTQPMFLFGDSVIPGMLGTNPIIPTNTNSSTNLAMQYDFRSVYASILKDWFCLSQGDISSVLLNTYQPLDIINPAGCISTEIRDRNQNAGENILDAYPNPFTDSTSINYTTLGGNTLLQVFDAQGRLIKTLVNSNPPIGTHIINLNMEEYGAGVYYLRLQNEKLQQVRNILKVR